MSGQAHGDAWDPRQYGLFGDERSRPFFELVSRVPATDPRRVVDLGCGSGELTASLAKRWPTAEVEGIDSSAKMIAAAQEHAAPGLRFTVGDLADWTPGDGRPVDVMVSNAALQWVPAHRDLLPQWIKALTPDGRLAFQVPGNFDAPSHALLREICRSPRWRARLADVMRWHPVGSPGEYLELLAGHGCRVDAWETTYAQVLQGDDPVLEWVKGTALRPVLSALDAEDAAEFLGEYAARLRDAYPRRPFGTVFPFRRIFVVAQRVR
ncbi:trans-aconitate 2-methyltransferase [Actinomadura sp. HBU206391]|uniref:trans-aconitate 2-methyltransferase n=1 Tax=Actinomadura sp. HBU206391 TaxID=2731692 RepID=UPI00164F9A8F|nr:trans-aconitate 2-methyltransferase [Actinomadura sp. HBU206391]MBC6459086.1 trans-aconitate 2-methyltransferase [Actinomadura sp. HBU206391]